MKAFLIVSIVMLSVVANSQEHSPALEQCRLDFDTYKKLGNFAHPTEAEFTAQRDYLRRFPLSEINRRIVEMESCMDVDQTHRQDYTDASLLLEGAQRNRYMNFLVRHNLWDQFVAEDAQGKR
jgi:hypothetical protein